MAMMPKWLFRLVWFRWLEEGDKIIRVKGWKTALIESRSGVRKTISPVFGIFR